MLSEHGIKRIPRPPGCRCGDATVDEVGNVLKVRTCRICSNILLASMRGVCYAIAYMRRGDTDKRVLLKQREFFSL